MSQPIDDAPRRRALVVDASTERNAGAVEAFERAGWLARTATSREAALTMLAETSYAAVVLYPGRMSGTGFDVVAAVRRQCKFMPIAVVLGAARSNAARDPRVLWFGGRAIDDSIHHAVAVACRSSARVSRRRDVGVTVPVSPDETTTPVPTIPRGALRTLRDLERAQLGSWVRGR